MATILSTELMSYFVPVLGFIFIAAIMYAVLERFAYFGKNKAVNIAISFSTGLLFILVPVARDLIREVIPWLIIMVVIIVVILMILMFMGYKETDIVGYMKENSFGAVIVTIVLLLFLISLGKVVGPALTQYPGPGEVGLASDLKRVLFNPKVLGVLFMLIVASYFMKVLAIPPKK